ncbi:hypothetical protein ACRAWD_03825 [Caulobacter segnis]
MATLLYEWRRYIRRPWSPWPFRACSFRATQVGIFVGIGKGFTAQIDRARADIMVPGPGAKALFGGSLGLPRRMIPLVYSHPEVTQVGAAGRLGRPLPEHPQPRAAGQGRGSRQARRQAGRRRGRLGPQERVRQRHGDRRDPRLRDRADRLHPVDDRGPAPSLRHRGSTRRP